ncbi:hypothetical protein niasHT_028489 [Heterodera trifolii]|uniref:CCHC-type domain-containing protein n=1 Tax=Heterodera trifolii TaxID=157864 RepID=A0ABD2KPS9_9BILA
MPLAQKYEDLTSSDESAIADKNSPLTLTTNVVVDRIFSGDPEMADEGGKRVSRSENGQHIKKMSVNSALGPSVMIENKSGCDNELICEASEVRIGVLETMGAMISVQSEQGPEEILISEAVKVTESVEGKKGSYDEIDLALDKANKMALGSTVMRIDSFELGDETTNIEDWLQQFCFALDCSAPNIKDEQKYKKSCLPKDVTDYNFAKTEEQLKALFAKPQSVWIDRYECLRASKSEDENFRPFINRHKRLLRDFEFKKLNEEQFYCLMLLTALKSPKDGELRKRILGKLAADGDRAKYDKVVEDLQMYLSTIAEAKCIEQPAPSKQIMAVKHNLAPKTKGFEARGQVQQQLKLCWRCGRGSHIPSVCPHIKVACRKCSKVGHLEAQCNQHQAWLARQGKMQSRKQGNLKLGGVLINSVNQPKRLIECPIKMNGNSVEFALDSGIGKPKLSPCNVEAKYHDGTKCTLLGKGEAEFEFGGIIRKGQFYVAKRGSLNLFGIEMLDAFGLMDNVRMKVAKTLNVNNVKKEESVVDETLIRLRAKLLNTDRRQSKFRKRKHAKTEQVVGRDGGRRKKSDERHRRLTAGARRAPANQSTACGSRADFFRSP